MVAQVCNCFDDDRDDRATADAAAMATATTTAASPDTSAGNSEFSHREAAAESKRLREHRGVRRRRRGLAEVVVECQNSRVSDLAEVMATAEAVPRRSSRTSVRLGLHSTKCTKASGDLHSMFVRRTGRSGDDRVGRDGAGRSRSAEQTARQLQQGNVGASVQSAATARAQKSRRTRST